MAAFVQGCQAQTSAAARCARSAAKALAAIGAHPTTNLIFPSLVPGTVPGGNNLWNPHYTGGAVTYTANALVAPDGATTATQVVTGANTGDGPYWRSTTLPTPNAVYTFSAYVYSTTAQTLAVVMAQTGGTAWLINPSQQSVALAANTWTRISVRAVAASAITATSTAYAIIASAANATFFVWGVQLELGAAATTYVPTTSGTVTSNPAGTLARSTAKLLQASGAQASSLSRAIAKALAAAGTAAAGTARAVAHALAANGVATGRLARSTARSVPAGASAGASIAKGAARTLPAASPPASALSRRAARVLAANAPAAGRLSRAVTVAIAASASASAGLLRSIARTLQALAAAIASARRTKAAPDYVITGCGSDVTVIGAGSDTTLNGSD